MPEDHDDEREEQPEATPAIVHPHRRRNAPARSLSRFDLKPFGARKKLSVLEED